MTSQAMRRTSEIAPPSRQELAAWIASSPGELVSGADLFYKGVLSWALRMWFRKVQKELVASLRKRVAEEYISDFLQGWKDGDKSKTPRAGMSPGYQYGYDLGVAGEFVSTEVQKRAIEAAIEESHSRVTMDLVAASFSSALKKIHPKQIISGILKKIRQHGWRLGLVLALGLVLDNLILPKIVYQISGSMSTAAVVAALPTTEILAAVVIAKLGVPRDAPSLGDGAALEWYEENFGPIPNRGKRAAHEARSRQIQGCHHAQSPFGPMPPLRGCRAAD